MMMASELVEIFPRRTFDLATLGAGGSASVVVAKELCVQGFGQAVVMLRVHANAMGSSRTATLRCVSEAPTEDDPDQDFLLESNAASLAVTPATTVGTLLTAGLTPDFSYALRFFLDTFNGSGSGTGGGTIELSAHLLLRAGVTRPGLYKHTFAYAPTDAAAYYVPFVTAFESATPAYRQTLIVPHAGHVDRVTLWCGADAGTTIVALHRNGSGTATATVTKSLPATTATEFRFPPTARFEVGDRIHINVNPTNAPGDVNGTLALKLDNEFLPTV